MTITSVTRHPAPPSPHSITQEENAATLKLGEEFQNTHCLFNSEVNILLERVNQERQALHRGAPLPAIFQQTLRYTNRLHRFQHQDMTEHVRRLLFDAGKNRLAEFEMAQLANLCPETSEEARILIPSLDAKIDEDSLQTLLDQLGESKKFQI